MKCPNCNAEMEQHPNAPEGSWLCKTEGCFTELINMSRDRNRPAVTAEVAEMAQRLNPSGILRTTTAPMSTSNDTHIILDKELRRDIDGIIQRLKEAMHKPAGTAEAPGPRASRERALSVTKLQESVMWLGMDLKAINEEVPGTIENPYPHSKDPSNTTIDPTADGLKL